LQKNAFKELQIDVKSIDLFIYFIIKLSFLIKIFYFFE